MMLMRLGTMLEMLPIELLLAVAVGLNLVALLLIWLQRKAGLPASRRDMSEAQEALRIAQVELPPRALGERIFATPDWEFISIQSPLRIQRMFLQERKAVALSWLRQTREHGSTSGRATRSYSSASDSSGSTGSSEHSPPPPRRHPDEVRRREG